jgi:hypothetical protein
MTHFEAYHWEDHVPRAGSWKYNLAAGVLALGLIYTALSDTSGDAPAVAAVAVPASGASDREMEIEKKPSGGRSAHRSHEVFAFVNYFAMQVSAVSGVHTSRPV